MFPNLSITRGMCYIQISRPQPWVSGSVGLRIKSRTGISHQHTDASGAETHSENHQPLPISLVYSLWKTHTLFFSFYIRWDLWLLKVGKDVWSTLHNLHALSSCTSTPSQKATFILKQNQIKVNNLRWRCRKANILGGIISSVKMEADNHQFHSRCKRLSSKLQ